VHGSLDKKSVKTKAVDLFDENYLFIKQFIKDPMRLGSLIPSSNTLADFMAQNATCPDDQYILEVGAGTGRFTTALLKNGIPENRLIIVEVEPDLACFLRKKFPNITVIEGCATKLHESLPEYAKGHIGTIVSGIPMVNLPKHLQKAIINSCFDVAAVDAKFLQFTYGPVSPIPCKSMKLRRAKLGTIMKNFPPATIWAYWRTQKV
jgi:phosphatidylethanolamine/phosphatidyl-N-methylethanolamine N-methyltransferase